MKLLLKDKFLAVRVKLELLFTADIVNLFLNMLRVSMTKCGRWRFNQSGFSKQTITEKYLGLVSAISEET